MILDGLHDVQQPVIARRTGILPGSPNLPGLRFGPPEPPNSLTITGSFAAAFSIRPIHVSTRWPLLL